MLIYVGVKGLLQKKIPRVYQIKDSGHDQITTKKLKT